MIFRFKQNPQSIPQTTIDKHTGEEVTRMINKGRVPSIAPASAKFGDPVRVLHTGPLRLMGRHRYPRVLQKAELNAFQRSNRRSWRGSGR